MNTHPDIESLIEDSTAGLKDDPELRLDVGQELRSHVNAAIDEHIADGKSEQESAALALRAFGTAPEIAQQLLNANKPRMKVRALVRLALRAFFVPAAVVVACTFWYTSARDLAPYWQIIYRIACNKSIGYDVGLLKFGRDTTWLSSLKNLTPDQRLIIWGDTNRPSPILGQRAIWEAHPTNVQLYANYMSAVLHQSSNGVSIIPDTGQFEAEVRRGEAFEPDNAHYNYILSDYLITKACTFEPLPTNGLSWPKPPVIHDTQLLERAIQEILTAQTKPRIESHSQDYYNPRFQALPAPRTFRQFMSACAGSVEHAYGCDHHTTANALVACAEHLASEGQTNQALAVLNAWTNLVLKTAAGEMPGWSFRYCDFACSAPIARAQEELGRPDLSARTLSLAAAITNSVPAWDSEERRGTLKQNLERDLLFKNQGSFILLRISEPPKFVEPEVLSPYLRHGRLLDQIVLERTTVVAFETIFLSLVLTALIAILRWRRACSRSSANILLLPPAKHVLTTLVYSVIIPLAAYAIYTALPGLSGRDLGTPRLWPRMLAELLLLTLVILSVIMGRTEHYIRARCAALGIPTPQAQGTKLRLISYAITPVQFLMLLTRRNRQFAAFTATYARSILPLLAVAVLLVSVASESYTAAKERHLVGYTSPQPSQPIWIQPNNFGAPFTADLVKFKTAVKNAIAKWQREWPEPTPSEAEPRE
jgi:hypothetical protein